MYIVQVCSGVLPRYFSHYLTIDTNLTPVITVSKSNAMSMSKADADITFSKLVQSWPLAQVIEA